MTINKRVQMLSQIDFGDIDGSGEPKLDQYFLDNDYWNRVVEKKTFFVIGRKGTGKSSIYRMIGEQAAKKACLLKIKILAIFHLKGYSN